MRRGAAAAVLGAVALALGAAPAGAAPRLTAASAFLVQPDTHDVVYARHEAERRPMASTTKMMTALVALDRFDLSDRLTVAPYAAQVGESVVGLRAGERMTFADLLRALLLASANDAAATIAVDAAGSEERFVEQMNRRARALGLRDTHFANPVGLDEPGNYSSARDLVELALVLRADDFVRRTVDRPSAVLHSGAHPRTVVNRNDLVLDHPFVTGVKTGHTLDAGYVLVGSARRGGVTVLSAVMGEPSMAARDADTLALLRYGLRRYHRVTPVRRGRVLARLPVRDQGDTRAALAPSASLGAVARRGERLRVRTVGLPEEVEGPLPAGARVGTVELLRRGAVVGRTALVTARSVPRATVAQRARAWAGSTWTIVALTILAACTVSLVLLRRRVVRLRRVERDPQAS